MLLKSTRTILVASLAWAASFTANATNYYISADGNDANTGTSQAQAWKTIGRMTQSIFSLQPGDQILFERGGTYSGKLEIPLSGTAAQPIKIGAYGAGNAPIISGGIDVPTWTVHQGNIWKATVTEDVKFLFSGGQLQTLARYPNTGWLRNDDGSATHITDAALTQPNGHWVGAQLVVRSSNWSYDTPIISGHTGTTITFPTVFSNLAQLDWGYFLQNKLSELDSPGEWYYSASDDQLYFQAPSNADPNVLNVKAAVKPHGVYVHWNVHHIKVQDLDFRYQTEASVMNSGGYNVTVQDCHFTDTYKGIHSFGHDGLFTGNTIEHTFATAAHIMEDDAVISNNTFQDVALYPGLGETTWGYMGLRVNGQSYTVSNNSFNNIGYIAINPEGSGTIEKNFVSQAMATLNDGGGIAFDNADGLIIQDNIITDLIGNLESSAPDFDNYVPINHGIYFGNTSIKNTIVRRNTVSKCAGSGIHVDHTMVSVNNQIKDNVLYDNEIQMSISDASNNTGPGAQPPYYVANFNDVYSGNIMYCLKDEQLCLWMYNTHSTAPVDFGTFTNNYYFNPWDEIAIVIHNTVAPWHKRFSLARWQAERGEDVGSTISPLHLNKYEVLSVIGNNLTPNGGFDSNVSGWGGWPTNAQLTQDYTYLDNGACKINFPNGTMYPTFGLRHSTTVNIISGNWYRMKFSLQSTTDGEVKAGFKTLSQETGPDMYGSKYIPFGPARRDVEMIFQCNQTEPGYSRFDNIWQEPVYWLDNVELERVTVQEVDPYVDHVLMYNNQSTAQDFPLTGCWAEVDGTLHSGSITIAAFQGVVLVRQDDAICGLSTGVDDEAPTTTNDVRVFPNPINAGGLLQFTQPLEQSTRFDLVDAQGRIMLSEQLSAGTKQLTLDSNMARGAYILLLTSAEGSKRDRLVVQ
ncbi:MAG: T9SS type A sorting domain-containing protein [Flavobacteriales bacterium]|nr:T9SS type A sorting domain-containing protein [Flavobacteriales bacterium]